MGTRGDRDDSHHDRMGDIADQRMKTRRHWQLTIQWPYMWRLDWYSQRQYWTGSYDLFLGPMEVHLWWRRTAVRG